MSKKEQKKLVKGVKKLVDEISFLLTPPGQEGVRALVESEFTSHYAGALPSALQALQSALGVSSEAPPSATEDVSVALTPFSPQPLRRSPRKPKPPPRALPEPAAQNRNRRRDSRNSRTAGSTRAPSDVKSPCRGRHPSRNRPLDPLAPAVERVETS